MLTATRDELALTGTPTHFLLSTMLCTNHKIDTYRERGLRVRGYNSNKSISLPSVYTHDVIPENRKHIPLSDVANIWPHPQSTAHECSSILDCTVGFLIGFNCPKAFAPERAILPPSNGPFAKKMVLCWGIVVAENSENDNCDAIGISHRVLA